MEDIVEFLQEKMSDYPYNIDQMMDLLQESRFELKKGGLESPPAPTNQEFPNLPPGSSLKRGVFETASARARKNKEKDKIIEVPHGKQVLPQSPVSESDGSDLNRRSAAMSSMGRNSGTSAISSDGNVRRSESLGRPARHVGNHSESNGSQSEGLGKHSGSLRNHLENDVKASGYVERSSENIARRSERRSERHSDSSGTRHQFPEVRYVSPEVVRNDDTHHRLQVEEPYHPSPVRLDEPVQQTPSPFDKPPSPPRSATTLSNAEIAKFNQDLKNSYLRSQQQHIRGHSGRRQNGSRSVPIEKMSEHSPSARLSDSEPNDLRRNLDAPTMVINLPGSVNVERNSYSDLRTPNGTSPLGHAPVWHHDGPEGSQQYTLTQSPNRQMTFV